MDETQEIVDFLEGKYDPEAVLLAGSRATGSADDTSDWDLFLFCAERYANQVIVHNGKELHLIFCSWPSPESYLDTQYGPLFPTKILLDTTGGKLSTLLHNTECAYAAGPISGDRTYYDARLEGLLQLQRKLEKYTNNAAVQFYYAGKAYEQILASWFEQQNKWPLPPEAAVAMISRESKATADLLNVFISHAGSQRSQACRDIIGILQKLHDENLMK